MTEGISVIADVVSFDPSGFADHDEAGTSTYPLAVLRVVEQATPGALVRLVLDAPIEAVELLTAGQRVRVLLDPESVGLDPLFSGALVDGAIHPGQPGEGRSS